MILYEYGTLLDLPAHIYQAVKRLAAVFGIIWGHLVIEIIDRNDRTHI